MALGALQSHAQSCTLTHMYTQMKIDRFFKKNSESNHSAFKDLGLIASTPFHLLYLSKHKTNNFGFAYGY